MTDQELNESNRQYDVLAAIAVGFGVLLVSLVAYFTLGVCTRVIGICSGASADWTKIFDWLFFTIPIGAVCSGLFAYQQFKKERLKKLLTKQNAK